MGQQSVLLVLGQQSDYSSYTPYTQILSGVPFFNNIQLDALLPPVVWPNAQAPVIGEELHAETAPKVKEQTLAVDHYQCFGQLAEEIQTGL